MLLSISANSFSQTTNSLDSLTSKDYYMQKSENQNTAAWVLLAGGLVITVVGKIKTNNDEKAALNNPSFTNLFPGLGGQLISLLGLGVLSGSGILFAASSRNKRKALSASSFFKMESALVIQNAFFVSKSYPAISIKINLK